MTRAIGYVRVSTEEQNLGPEAQRAELHRWCEAHGAQLEQIHEDHGLSGALPLERRTGLIAAIDALEQGSVLLVAKRDRLVRGDPVLAAMIERLVARAGARVVSCAGEGNGDDPTSVLMRRIVDAFAEYERLLIKARTRAALAVRRARGQKTGGYVPYGYRLVGEGRLEEDQGEQAVIRTMVNLAGDGLSCRRIAGVLNQQGIPTRCAGRTMTRAGRTWVHTGEWTHAQVGVILARAGALEEANNGAATR